MIITDDTKKKKKLVEPIKPVSSAVPEPVMPEETPVTPEPPPKIPTFLEAKELAGKARPSDYWTTEQVAQQDRLANLAVDYAIARGVSPSAKWLWKIEGEPGEEQITSLWTESGWEIKADNSYTSPEGISYSYDEMVKLANEEATKLEQIQSTDWAGLLAKNAPEYESGDLNIEPDYVSLMSTFFPEIKLGAENMTTNEASDRGLLPRSQAKDYIIEHRDELISRQEARTNELQELAGLVFPEQNVDVILRWMQEDMEGFVDHLRNVSRTPNSDKMLRTLWPTITDNQIRQIFGQTPILSYNEWEVKVKADVPESSKWLYESYKTNYETYVKYMQDTGIGNTLARSLTAGSGDLFAMLAAGAKWLGADGVGKTLSDIAAPALAVSPDVINPGPITFESLWNPDFWKFTASTMTRQIPTQIPLILLGVISGGAGYALGESVSTAISAGRIGSFALKVLGSFAGSLPPTVLEAGMEGASAYDNALNSGLSPTEAHKVANEVFKNNLFFLSGSNTAQTFLAFLPFTNPLKTVSNAVGRNLVKTAVVGGKLTIQGLTQGGEEIYQDFIQKQARGEDFDFASDEEKLVFLIGGAFGVAFGAGAEVYQAFSQRVINSLPEEVKTQTQDEIKTAVDSGTPVEQATKEALDKVADTKEGKSAIEAVTKMEKIEAYEQAVKPKNAVEQEVWANTFEAQKNALKEQYPDVNIAEKIELGVFAPTKTEIKVSQPITKDIWQKFTRLEKSESFRIRGASRPVIDIWEEIPEGLRIELGKGIEIPQAEQGMPEAGLQTETDQLALQQYQLNAELEGLKYQFANEPASKLVDLIKKTGWYKGEIKDLTLAQYRKVFNQEPPKNILTKDGKHVRWEYSLDTLATELGYSNSDALKTAIESSGETLARIKQLEKGGPGTPKWNEFGDIMAIIPTGKLTINQIDSLLSEFGKAISSEKSSIQREATLSLRKAELAKRAFNLQNRIDQLIIEGINPEEAVKQAEKETMSGELPRLDTDFFSDLTQDMRNVLYGKVYEVLRNEPFEMMSTSEALTNALLGKAIPREPGVKGGSAYTRLMRVFGDNPDIMKVLDSKRPFEDIVEGSFEEISEPIPLDQGDVQYLLSLPEKGRQVELFAGPTKSEVKLAIEGEYKATKTRLDEQFNSGRITKGEYDIQLAHADEMAHGTDRVNAYEPEINDIINKKSVFSRKQQVLIIRALKETGSTIVDIGNFLRANKASIDMSFGRQMAPLIPMHAKSYLNWIIKGWHSIWSHSTAEAEWQHLIKRPIYSIYDKCGASKGFDFIRPFELPKGTESWKGVEEYGFLNTERPIPRMTANLPWVRASQDSFVTSANGMLLDIYENYYNKILKVNEKVASGKIKLKEGQAFSIEDEMSKYAQYLSNMSGRAPISGKMGELAPVANSLFFSLRLNLGRLFSVKSLVSSDKYIRTEAYKDFGSFVGTISFVILVGAALGWWDAELDPRSADFMKVRIGNTRIDPWGGYQQFIVFFSRIVSKTGLVSTTGMEYNVDFLSSLTTFLRSKASPLASTMLEFWTGKTFLGEKVDITDPKQWIDRLAPFAVLDIYDAWADQGLMGAMLGIPSIFGVNLQTYTGDWKENFTKLGLPKFTDNTLYGEKEPVYDTGDFWSDTASQFKGIDPSTITAKRGYSPAVISIVEGMQYKAILDSLPSGKWIDLDLAKIDRTKIPQSIYVLLTEYQDLPESKQEQFLIDHPELNTEPRDEWLKNHTQENALLALWGQADPLTSKALTALQKLVTDLDIPSSAIELPPTSQISIYGQYIDASQQFGSSSPEAKLIRLQNKEFEGWLESQGKNPLTDNLQSIQIKVKYKINYDYYDSLGDKDSPNYIQDLKARTDRRENYLKTNTGFRDDRWRQIALDAELPSQYVQMYVAYQNLDTDKKKEAFRLNNVGFDKALYDSGLSSVMKSEASKTVITVPGLDFLK